MAYPAGGIDIDVTVTAGSVEVDVVVTVTCERSRVSTAQVLCAEIGRHQLTAGTLANRVSFYLQWRRTNPAGGIDMESETEVAVIVIAG